MNKEEMFDALMKYSDSVRIGFCDLEFNVVESNEFSKRQEKMAEQTKSLQNWNSNELPFRKEWIENFKKVAESGLAMQFIEHHEENGSIGLYKVLKFPVKNSEGKIVGLGGIVKSL